MLHFMFNMKQWTEKSLQIEITQIQAWDGGSLWRGEDQEETPDRPRNH